MNDLVIPSIYLSRLYIETGSVLAIGRNPINGTLKSFVYPPSVMPHIYSRIQRDIDRGKSIMQYGFRIKSLKPQK